MTEKQSPVNIKVLGKQYRIACSAEEQDDLLESARYLDQKMREVMASGRVVGDERIAVMAALNISHELAQSTRQQGLTCKDINDQLKQIETKIDTVLESKQSGKQ